MDFRFISIVFILFSLQNVFAVDCNSFLKGRTLKCSDDKPRDVHLTFDDGPAVNKKLTPKVLDTLLKFKNEINGNVTFFIAGDRFTSKTSSSSDKYKLLEKMKKENYRIGSHAYKHVHHSSLEKGKFKAPTDKIKYSWRDNLLKSYEINKLNKYLTKDGQKIIRLPYGEGWDDDNRAVMSYLEENKMTHVYWDIDSGDSHKYEDVIGVLKKKKKWISKNNETYNRGSYVFEVLKDQICKKDGGIILFHDIKPHTSEYLGCYLTALKNAGHKHVPLENFNSRMKGKKPVIGHFYNPSKISSRSCSVSIGSIIESQKENFDPIKQLLKSLEEDAESSFPIHIGSYEVLENAHNSLKTANKSTNPRYKECIIFDHIYDLNVYRVKCKR